jgi:hypothetical protein
MRALTQEEWEALAEAERGTELAEEQPIDLQWQLVGRGCLAHSVEQDPDGETWDCFTLTPLGRLALRVSRPEMAVRLP